MKNHNLCAGGVFTTPEESIIFQLRDNKPGIRSPGMIHVFGGGVETDESEWQAFLREMKEETGLPRSRIETARFLCRLEEQIEGSAECNQVFLCVVPRVNPAEITVLEGQGIIVVDRMERIDESRFTPLAVEVLRLVREEDYS